MIDGSFGRVVHEVSKQNNRSSTTASKLVAMVVAHALTARIGLSMTRDRGTMYKRLKVATTYISVHGASNMTI